MSMTIVLGVYNANFITKNTAIFILLKALEKTCTKVGEYYLTVVLVLSDNKLYTIF